MYTENGVVIDVAHVRDVIRTADVFTIAFRLFPERLLIDTRYDATDRGDCAMPMVAIVDPVETVQDRFFWLGQHRPALGTPRNFQFLYWPHGIMYLEASGVWAEIRARVVLPQFTGAEDTCADALADLMRRERQANVDAIMGRSHHTVWSVEST
jgi:hypothetical protein